ncbi:tetratricopeptide repeat protein [Streptomyces oryzae]|uniref:Tetratricopeptide repeat protein n=1 Tax=Streptomyces oryzae TaxID=1434886 RepID=A0ABS3XAJ5_9ACTN|nr:tetratricopeptide repeat protein [Streptomyces oryzae]MBO8192383.1 tetratricopeptide repeat protein [Streptomyces oryzae]
MSEQTRNTVDGQVSTGAIVQAASIGAVHHHTHAAPQQPTAPPVQLPVEAAYFEDRDTERADIARALVQRRGRSDVVRPLVVAVSGIGGVGKSALGLRLAHETYRERGCGALYVDLDDVRREGAVAPGDVLAVLLRGLGVYEPWLAKDFAGRRRQYEQHTTDRELVVVLDNVAYTSEVEPLLPVSSESVAIVISRRRLDGLLGALEVPLGPLPGQAAEGLLHSVLEGTRPAGGPGTVAEIARLCGGLPAALHVAGRYLRTHRRRPPERLVAALRTELDEEGLPVVEAVWDAAYRELSAPAARLYRLLAEHPGPTFTAASAAALLGTTDPDTVYDALGELEDANLVAVWQREGEGDGAAERLRMHDLLRAHAQRRARDDSDPAEAAAAVRRVVRWYRRQLQEADKLLTGSRMRFATAVLPLPYAPDVAFGDRAEAARWMRAEESALYACVHLARGHGERGDPESDADAWGLCESLWTHFKDHQHHAEAIDAFRAGLAAAQRAENLAAQARMRCQLANALWEVGDLAEARTMMDHAVEAAAALPGEPKLRASTLEFRGLLHRAEGDLASAVEQFTASRRIHEEIPNPYGVLLQSYLLGKTLIDQGDPQGAAEELERAHDMAVEQDRERMIGRTAYELARALCRLDAASDDARVGALYERALASARTRGADHDEAAALHALADFAEAGEDETAAAHRARALAIEARAGGVVERG